MARPNPHSFVVFLEDQLLQATRGEGVIWGTKLISDLSGLTGMKILQAIVEGERDADKLARLAAPGTSDASKRTGAEPGTALAELLFVT